MSKHHLSKKKRKQRRNNDGYDDSRGANGRIFNKRQSYIEDQYLSDWY